MHPAIYNLQNLKLCVIYNHGVLEIQTVLTVVTRVTGADTRVTKNYLH
jgi:hypothetical protein